MKRNLKSLFAVLLSLTVFCSGLTVRVKAEEPEQQMSEQDILEEIYSFDPNFSYEGELVAVTKSTGSLLSNYPSVGVPYGSIGDQNMSIYITVSRISETGKDKFGITATARWLNVPTVRMQDAFALCWGGSFALISSNAQASYKSSGILSGKTSVMSTAPNAGIGYSVECSDYYAQALDWVRIYAQISEYDRTGTANVTASYCHQKASLGINGIVLNGNNVSISFNAAGAVDTLSAYTSFAY